jgi:hypothetical protein
MLTVKLIDENGIETVREIKSVIYKPARETDVGKSCVTYFTEEFPPADVFWGDVYIMNTNGKTVADYCLGHPTIIGGCIQSNDISYCKA